MDKKLNVICDVFSVLTAFKPIVANYNITKSPKPAARLAIIQLKSLVQKQITNLSIKISKYSR